MDNRADKAYWDGMSHRYDSHIQKSAKMYGRMVELITEHLTAETTVLDIGTGTGEIPLQIASRVRHVEAVDYSEEMISIAQNKARTLGIGNLNFRVQDSFDLQYDDNTFDAVLVANTLHVVQFPDRLLAQAHRVLRDTGTLFAPTYVHNESLRTRMISWVLRRMGHPVYTRYDSHLLKETIDRNNFEVVHQELLESIMPVSFVVAKKRNK